ncbi:hypothetical protein D3C79_570660 [compost metagenome]
MAHEQQSLVGEGQQAADRLVQGASISAWEVTACGTVVGHEQGVAHEQCFFSRILYQVTHASGGMPRRVQRAGVQVTYAKAFFVHEQHIELAAITGEARLGVEQVAEDFLYLGDLGANGGVAAELFLEIRRS